MAYWDAGTESAHKGNCRTLGKLGIETLFEPTKICPKDSMFLVTPATGFSSRMANKIDRTPRPYTLISKHLLLNSISPRSATLVRVPGILPPDVGGAISNTSSSKRMEDRTYIAVFSHGLTGGGHA